MFSHHLRMLAFVPRWQIAPRFRTQNVAEHSFFVALYANQLAELAGLNPYERLQVVECALTHDVAEARTGDMPGPVKRAVVDRARLEAYEGEQLDLMGVKPHTYSDRVLAIVKVADLIDELFHVATEIAMGNSLIQGQRYVTEDRLRNAVIVAGLPLDVFHAVTSEVKDMEQGVSLPVNKPETDPLTTYTTEDIPF